MASLRVTWAIAVLRNSASEEYSHQLVIISFILVTLTFDSRVILKVEIKFWSLFGVNGLIKRKKLNIILEFDVCIHLDSHLLREKVE